MTHKDEEDDVSNNYEDEEAAKDNVLFNNWCSPMDGGSCEYTCSQFVKELNKCEQKVLLRKSFIGEFILLYMKYLFHLNKTIFYIA